MNNTSTSDSSYGRDGIIKDCLRVLLYASILAVLFFSAKKFVFGEDRTVVLALPYTVEQIIDFQKTGTDIYGIVYIDKNTRQRKTLSVLYNQGDPLMADPWNRFLKHQIHVYYDLPPGNQSYARIYPEKYTPGNIFNLEHGGPFRTYKYNMMEIHMPMPDKQ